MESEPLSVLIGVAIAAGLYGLAAVRARPPIPRGQAVAFAGAMVTILLALGGPVDELADERLFTAHMLQHLLLALVMPPLLLLGSPAWMVRYLLRPRALRRLAAWVTRPLFAFILYNGFLAVVHTPPVFESMVRDDTLHVALHIGMMITGTIMWWPLLSPLPEMPRLSYPAQMLYLFLLLIPMAAISAPITLAGAVIYPWYLEGPHPWGLTPLSDQMMGGLLMWVGGGLYFMCAFSVMFFRWAQREDIDVPTRHRPAARLVRVP